MGEYACGRIGATKSPDVHFDRATSSKSCCDGLQDRSKAQMGGLNRNNLCGMKMVRLPCDGALVAKLLSLHYLELESFRQDRWADHISR